MRLRVGSGWLSNMIVLAPFSRGERGYREYIGAVGDI